MNPGEGAVTALAFHTPAGAAQPTHLLSGSADGTFCVWAAGGSWDCLKASRSAGQDTINGLQPACCHTACLQRLSVCEG